MIEHLNVDEIVGTFFEQKLKRTRLKMLIKISNFTGLVKKNDYDVKMTENENTISGTTGLVKK